MYHMYIHMCIYLCIYIYMYISIKVGPRKSCPAHAQDDLAPSDSCGPEPPEDDKPKKPNEELPPDLSSAYLDP